ncbi:DUF1232 domain-containing protein [Candidatus Magnetobacterium casensis]|uniref:DUF1232 domain-containing protein n=2 Tax=Candidatus Magnetobacterium casense TaxID=1455061 RepID=A0ABS6S111_9BACT|nr:DUF1232 domain-containing protein [Candidatus Magnetobacterium casensis]
MFNVTIETGAMKLPSDTLKELKGNLLKKGAEGYPGTDGTPQGTPPDKGDGKSLKLALLLMLLALVYDVSPVDVVPDVPIVGWIDDFFVTAAAALNVIHAMTSAQNSALTKLVSILKWMVIFIGIIAICVVLISMLGIIKFITS